MNRSKNTIPWFVVWFMVALLIISIITLAIAIHRNEGMKNWFKENVFCCFGAKEEKDLEEQKPMVKENLEEKRRKEKIDRDIEELRDAVNNLGKVVSDGCDRAISDLQDLSTDLKELSQSLSAMEFLLQREVDKDKNRGRIKK